MMHHRCFVHRWPRGRLEEAIIVSYTSCRSSVRRSFSWSSMDARTPSVGLSSMQMTKPPVRHFKTGQRYRWRLSYSRLSRPLARVKHELLVGKLTFVMRATWPRIADNDWRCPLCRTVRVKYFLTVEITRRRFAGRWLSGRSDNIPKALSDFAKLTVISSLENRNYRRIRKLTWWWHTC